MDTKPQVTPARILGALLAGWWILAISAVVGGALAFGYSSLQAPIYQSTASTYFSMRSASSGSDINQGSAYTQNQMLSFAQLAMSSLVLDEVRRDISEDLTNQQIRAMTSVSIPQNTVILDVTAASTDPEFAAELANSIAENLAAAVEDIAPKDDAGIATVVARVIEPATPALYQSSPNKQRDALLGAIAGGLIAALAIAIWALVDTRVRSEAVLRRLTDLPVLGAIPLRNDKTRRPIVITEPNGSSAEAYRQVRSSLRFAAVEHDITAVAVTSSIPGEGKTTAAVNIALTYAEAGLRVLLVDADLRRPMVAETLGLENSVGLTTVLVGAVDFDDAKLAWGDSTLWVLPAGLVPPNPAELLASQRMTDVLIQLRAQFDIMIVDTAPLLSVADATIIAQEVDATIVVADVSKVRLAQLDRSLTALSTVQAQVAGILLSRVRRNRRDDYYYYGPAKTGAGRSGKKRPGGASAFALPKFGRRGQGARDPRIPLDPDVELELESTVIAETPLTDEAVTDEATNAGALENAGSDASHDDGHVDEEHSDHEHHGDEHDHSDENHENHSDDENHENASGDHAESGDSHDFEGELEEPPVTTGAVKQVAKRPTTPRVPRNKRPAPRQAVPREDPVT